MDWKLFLKEAEICKDKNAEVRVSVNTQNGFSKSVSLKEFIPLISEYQRFADVCKFHGFNTDDFFHQALNQGISRIREKIFVSEIGKALSLKYPDTYIRIEWHEANEYFVEFYGFEGDESEAVAYIDRIHEDLDKDEAFYLLPFFHTTEQTKKYYPNYVGKKGVETV